ncbi:UNKNOWN [Stylonychia lemnae]|uniref:Uncharacterized protein n=1 Tax=Stylonychia lemnae TaxID=5949 RepID=A0A078ABS4_STYLE|nr:UNKNOWN [Stylonychia lemnae]|eukprot:CDW79042.1 UNKNOWN [Stylonychia lemnae]
MIFRKETQIKKNSLINASNQHQSPENLSLKNITIAWMISDFIVSDQYENKSHGEMKLKQWFVKTKINATTGVSYKEFSEYFIPYSKCELNKNFFYNNHVDIELYGLEKFNCPDYNNLTIQGSWFSPEYTAIQLIFQRCEGGFENNCSSDEDFKMWLSKIFIEQLIINTYFDPDDYENPIHYFLEETYISFQYGRSVLTNLFFKKNEIRLFDDYFGMFPNTKVDYHYQKSKMEYQTADVNEGPGQGILYLQEIKIDQEYDIYERHVYSFQNLLQDIGGFFNSLYFCGLIFYSQIRNSIFYTELISRLYQVEPIFVNLKTKTFTNFSSRRLQHRDITQSEASSYFVKELRRFGNKLNMTLIRGLLTNLRNRWRLKYKCCDIFQVSFKGLQNCLVCKEFQSNRSKLLNELKSQVFEKGQARVIEELDCINLLSRMRQFDLLLSLLLDDRQKYMINFQKNNVIQKLDLLDQKVILGLITKNPNKIIDRQASFKGLINAKTKKTKELPQVSSEDSRKHISNWQFSDLSNYQKNQMLNKLDPELADNELAHKLHKSCESNKNLIQKLKLDSICDENKIDVMDQSYPNLLNT